MDGPYIAKQLWPSFTYNEQTYDFDHLAEHQIEVVDTSSLARKIAVTFTDHCFTREFEPSDDPAIRYPASRHGAGCFCLERYKYSLELVRYVNQAVNQKIWITGEGRYALVPTVEHHGVETLYGICFTLKRVKGLPVNLHMEVTSAHPRDKNPLGTHGSIGFRRLVSLSIEGKHPRLDDRRDRKRPRIGEWK